MFFVFEEQAEEAEKGERSDADTEVDGGRVLCGILPRQNLRWKPSNPPMPISTNSIIISPPIYQYPLIITCQCVISENGLKMG